jgi:di/tricarboxylate transporter
MTLQQILAFAVIAGTMALFVWGRLRYDLVAGIALLVAVLIGVVPADKAFSGFSDDIVVIVAGALQSPFSWTWKPNSALGFKPWSVPVMCTPFGDELNASDPVTVFP